MTPDRPGWWWRGMGPGYPPRPVQVVVAPHRGETALDYGLDNALKPVMPDGSWLGSCAHPADASGTVPPPASRPDPKGVKVTRCVEAVCDDDVRVTNDDGRGRVLLLVSGESVWIGSPADARIVAAALVYIADEVAYIANEGTP